MKDFELPIIRGKVAKRLLKDLEDKKTSYTKKELVQFEKEVYDFFDIK